MLRMHHIAVQYGISPAEQVGAAPHTWRGWIVNLAAQRVGDQHRAAMVKRAELVFPVVAIQ